MGDDESVKRLAELLILPPTSLYIGVLLGLTLAWLGGKRARVQQAADGQGSGRWTRRWTWIGKALASLSALALIALSVPQNAFWLLDSLQTSEAIPPTATSIDADAIVILSGDVDCDPPEYGPDQPGFISLQRCRYGAALAKRTGLPLLISGGVLRPDRRPVAEVLRDFVQDELGVPVRWVEGRSKNTRQNAAFSAALLAEDGIRKVAVVTHAWHMPRAIIVCEDAGLEVLPAPTAPATPPANLRDAIFPRASAFQHSYWAIHEWIGRLWYSLT